MRLIDADELIEFLKKVTITDGITFETGFKQILTDIKNQPTVEPKRGEWVMRGGKSYCSNCGKLTLMDKDRDDWYYHKQSDWCPHCGADMRKKVEE